MRRVLRILFRIVIVLGAITTQVGAQDSRESVNYETSKPIVRGGIVYKAYCVVCHGERGDGVVHSVKSYPGRDLTINIRPHEYYEKIVRHGGHGVGMSSFMPAWQYELSEEQIGDVIAYVTIVKDAAKRGEVVYKTNCILCHGVNADGKGRAAIFFRPTPIDLTHSSKNDTYKLEMIRRGSKAMGRSSGMPSWDGKLTSIEQQDVIEYLRTLSATPPANQTNP